MKPLAIGDTVRAYDSDLRTSYIEGVLVDQVPNLMDRERNDWVIYATRQVIMGEVYTQPGLTTTPVWRKFSSLGPIVRHEVEA